MPAACEFFVCFNGSDIVGAVATTMSADATCRRAREGGETLDQSGEQLRLIRRLRVVRIENAPGATEKIWQWSG